MLRPCKGYKHTGQFPTIRACLEKVRCLDIAMCARFKTSAGAEALFSRAAGNSWNQSGSSRPLVTKLLVGSGQGVHPFVMLQ